MRTLRAVSVLVFVVLLASCSSDSGPPAASASAASDRASTSASAASPAANAPDCNRPHPSGQTTETLDFDGVNREYELYVPPSYDGTQAVPVVFNFHGYGSTAKEQMVYGNFKPEADQDDFLIVALDGQGEGQAKHFNLLGEKGLQDDVAVTLALLDHMKSTFCVDSKRIFSTGMSDGGAMTSVLACRQADTFAAFGAVAVEFYRDGCAGDRKVAFLAFHGTDDPVVPYNGGNVRCCGGVPIAASTTTLANWAAHDGCDPNFTDAQLDTEVSQRTWTGCAGGEVILYTIVGGGHTWPGSLDVPRLGHVTKQIDASKTIWEFFKRHPMT